MKRATTTTHERELYEQVFAPLLGLFALVDDVYTEDDALSQANVYKTAGRIYRGWKDCRQALDPTFNARIEGQRVGRWNPTAMKRKPLSISAMGSKTPSSALMSMTEKNHLISALRGNSSA